jgi:hypothetical protein
MDLIDALVRSIDEARARRTAVTAAAQTAVWEQSTESLRAQVAEIEARLDITSRRLAVDTAANDYNEAVDSRGIAEDELDTAEKRGLRGPRYDSFLAAFEDASSRVESAWDHYQEVKTSAEDIPEEDAARLDQLRDELAYRSNAELCRSDRHLHAVPDAGL